MFTVCFANIPYNIDRRLSEMALKSIASFSRLAPADCPSLEEQLRAWVAQLFRSGMSPLTIKRYVQSLHSVYESVTKTSDDNSAELFITLLHEISQSSDNDDEHSTEASAVKLIASGTKQLNAAQRLYLDAFLYMIYTRGTSIEDVITLPRNSDTSMLPPQAIALAETHRKPHSRRAFPFSAEENATGGADVILRKIDTVVNSITESKKITVAPDTALSLWIACALECGIRAEEIRPCISHIPESHSWLRFIKPSILIPEEIYDIACHVADYINPNRPAWYAMRLRSGITPTAIRQHLRKSDATHMVQQYFYPCQEIARRTGRKLTFDSRPYIADILFFKALPRDLRPLFSTIGHMAWCYRNTNSTQSDYARIPDRSMQRFQSAIGIFTPDLTPKIQRSADFSPGIPVRIVAGPRAGLVGWISKTHTNATAPVADATGIGFSDENSDFATSRAEDSGAANPSAPELRRFSIRLSASDYLTWEETFDETFLSPIPDSDLRLYPELTSDYLHIG